MAGAKKLTVKIGERRTTMRLSPVETAALRRICSAEGLSLSQFCTRAVETGAYGERNHTGRVRDAIVGYLLARWSHRRAAPRPSTEKYLTLQEVSESRAPGAGRRRPAGPPPPGS